MEFSRRDMALLLSALGASELGFGQEQKPGSPPKPAENAVLEGKIYHVDSMPWRNSTSGVSKSRALFNGFTTRGQHLTMHMTELAPGQAPHPAARQPHEEILILRQGTVECTIKGEKATLEAGAVVYSAYNDLKDWKNAGSDPAVYYVISLEEHK